MSTLTIELEDRLSRELARAAEQCRKPVAEWAKAELAAAAGRTVTSTADLFSPPPLPPTQRVLGLHEGEPYFMAADFDAPLDDFADYK